NPMRVKGSLLNRLWVKGSLLNRLREECEQKGASWTACGKSAGKRVLYEPAMGVCWRFKEAEQDTDLWRCAT
ncbi:hypothetical protein, partial [Atopobium sp. oral taxon 810]|uniref:hypothetical protein n=1 Tax=Atopobium sp. oral taxon 810 TaxID=712158 RepID=UPI00039734E3